MIQQQRKKTRGFSLVEIAIVLLIIGLAFGMIVGVTGSLREGQQRSTVRTQLETIDTALANFVALYKRLPCPADGTIDSGTAGVGLETLWLGPTVPSSIGNCNPNNQANGVVPWVTLGLSEADATDPWGGRISYRVDPALATGSTFPRLMDMSNCDPASIGLASAIGECKIPAAPCTSSPNCTSPAEFLKNKGLDVWDGVNGAVGWALRQNNRSAGTGAAYVLISHGPSGGGAYNKSGVSPQPGNIASGTADETFNLNGGALLPPPPASVAAPGPLLSLPPPSIPYTYRDAPMNDRATTAHFDDYLSHPTIMTVLMKANLGPRAHTN
ncbi:type II secretion system protein [Undibacterium sp. Di24W]|uniref:type II secretion system protein n=1 Tax=Undibacterium sp. Di24W TaxID=3413033 RepID=UPI003BEF8069